MRAAYRSRPLKGMGTTSLRLASASKILMSGRPARWAMSKSFGSWAGVTFTAPVPNSASTWWSATIGSRRPSNGWVTVEPTSAAYRSSPGRTAIPVSPSIVSTRVVATSTYPLPSVSGYLNVRSSPSTSSCSTSESLSPVWSVGHQLTSRSPR